MNKIDETEERLIIKEIKKKNVLKNMSIIGTTIGSALISLLGILSAHIAYKGFFENGNQREENLMVGIAGLLVSSGLLALICSKCHYYVKDMKEDMVYLNEELKKAK